MPNWFTSSEEIDQPVQFDYILLFRAESLIMSFCIGLNFQGCLTGRGMIKISFLEDVDLRGSFPKLNFSAQGSCHFKQRKSGVFLLFLDI